MQLKKTLRVKGFTERFFIDIALRSKAPGLSIDENLCDIIHIVSGKSE